MLNRLATLTVAAATGSTLIAAAYPALAHAKGPSVADTIYELELLSDPAVDEELEFRARVDPEGACARFAEDMGDPDVVTWCLDSTDATQRDTQMAFWIHDGDAPYADRSVDVYFELCGVDLLCGVGDARGRIPGHYLPGELPFQDPRLEDSPAFVSGFLLGAADHGPTGSDSPDGDTQLGGDDKEAVPTDDQGVEAAGCAVAGGSSPPLWIFVAVAALTLTRRRRVS